MSRARSLGGTWPLGLALLALGCSGGSNEYTPTDAQAHDAAMPDAPAPRDATVERAFSRDGSGRDGDATDASADAPVTDAWTTEFDGTLAVHAGPCNTGEIGATYLGIPAFCQPPSATGYYQCDELANRFMRDALQHPDLDNVVTDYASSICGKASSMSAYSVWGPGDLPTTGAKPVGGDLVVFTGMPGHIAVVVGFSSPTEVTIIQQNGGPSVSTFGWDTTTSFFVLSSFRNPECWVHPESAPPAELPDASACGCFTGSDTCGLAIVDYEWWNGCKARVPEGGVQYRSLYSCDAGVYTKTADCPTLCITQDLFDASGHCGK